MINKLILAVVISLCFSYLFKQSSDPTPFDEPIDAIPEQSDLLVRDDVYSALPGDDYFGAYWVTDVAKTGPLMLGVRADGDYAPIQLDQSGRVLFSYSEEGRKRLKHESNFP